jgi:ComF family protein
MKRYCVFCAAPSGTSLELCEACARDLPAITTPCRRCGNSLPNPGTCGRCLRSPPAYSQCIAAFRYEYPLDRLVVAMKFREHLGLASLLGTLLAAKLETSCASSLPDCIIPVPLHRRRLMARGFNQALEIARPVAKRFEIALDPSLCVRTRSTIAQASLPAAKRRKNVKSAFVVGSALRLRHVVIVDDVLTTGSTVDELTKVILAAGAERVSVWVVALANKPVHSRTLL